MPRSIIVVEDEEDLRDSLVELFAEEGLEVAAARDGLEALQALAEADRPCVVLLDLIMPGVDGWAFLEMFSARDDRHGVEVIITTSAPSSAPPGYRVMKKPVDIEQLLRVIGHDGVTGS